MPNAKKSILQPKNDVVFKALFSRGKPRITQAMLEAILKMKIDKLELDKSTDLLNENADDKNGRLDLRAIINGNTECDIEGAEHGIQQFAIPTWYGRVSIQFPSACVLPFFCPV